MLEPPLDFPATSLKGKYFSWNFGTFSGKYQGKLRGFLFHKMLGNLILWHSNCLPFVNMLSVMLPAPGAAASASRRQWTGAVRETGEGEGTGGGQGEGRGRQEVSTSFYPLYLSSTETLLGTSYILCILRTLLGQYLGREGGWPYPRGKWTRPQPNPDCMIWILYICLNPIRTRLNDLAYISN